MSPKLFALFVLLCIAPVWVFEFVPLTDYPRHLLIAHVIKNGGRGFEGFFELNLLAVPNSLGHFLIAALNFFMPIFVAGKVFLSVLIALFAFGTRYFFGSLNKRNNWLPFFAVVFLFTVPFVAGFINFLLAVSISFFALGYWARNIEKAFFASQKSLGKKCLREMAILSALGLLVFLSHLMVFFFLFFITAVAAFFYFNKPKAIVASISHFALAFAAAALFFFATASNDSSFLPITWSNLWHKWDDFWFLLAPIGNDLGRASMVFAFLALGAAACELFLVKKSKRIHFRGHIKAGFFASVVFGLLLSLLLPSWMGSYGFITSRLALFLLFISIAIVGEPQKKLVKTIFIPLVGLAAVCAVASAFLFFSQQQQGIADHVSATNLVEMDSRLLPLSDWDASFFPSWLHSYCYYLIEKGGVAPYIGLTKMWPIDYKDESFKIAPPAWQTWRYSNESHAKNFDYVLAYGDRAGYQLELDKGFEKIFEKGLFALYKKKSK